VVIKTVSAGAVPASVQHRLVHESEVLSTLKSPFLTPIVEVGRHDGLFYLVEPAAPGITLEERLRRGPLSVAEALHVAECVLEALREAHEHGVVHRDVKPANVLVDGDAQTGSAVLIDFGFSRSSQLDVSVAEETAGTVLYMSPEQAGLLDAEVDERSDLYSTGVLLFECLSGQPPFSGKTITDMLWQHLTAAPPELWRVRPGVPHALGDVVQRMLRKDPRDRYQSASGVLADLELIEAAVARGVDEPSVVIGLHDHRPFLTEPAFVGRGFELDALEHQMARASRGQGGLVLLEAESGGGKTRLLDALAHRSDSARWVLRGQGLANVGQRPFQILLGVVQEIAATARREPVVRRGLQDRVGDVRDAVCAAFPDLEEILCEGRKQKRGRSGGARASASDPLGPETLTEERTARAVSLLLDALGTQEVPAMLLLDDAQWADEAALKLLARWHKERGQAGTGHVLVVVSFRSEEVGPTHALRGLRGAASVVLAPLAPEAIRDLAKSMAGQLPEEALRVVVELSDGSPFMANAVLRGMVESGALVHEAGAWRGDAAAIAEARSSRHAAVLLARRIELLPPDAIRLLSAGAVLGREFDLDLATELSSASPEQALGALKEARSRHMIWMKAEGSRAVFAHDRIREAVLARLPGPERLRHHRTAALRLEASAPAGSFDIAYHFDAAGTPELALPHALVGADRARSQHALEIAEQQFRIARRGSRPEDEATRRTIAEGLGEVHMLQGRYDDAARELEEARRLARSSLDAARIEGKLGELAFKRGDVQTATAAIERGLGMLGRGPPRRSIAFVAGCLWEVLVQALHTFFPRRFLAKRPLEGSAPAFLAIRLYSRLAHTYFFQHAIPTLWAHLRGLNLAERYPPTLDLAQAYSEHAPVMTLVPYFSRGITYAWKSHAIRKAFGDTWGQGQSLNFLGIVLYAASKYDECILRCSEAARLLERTGDRWEVNIARWHLAYSLYRRGDMRDAVDAARDLHRRGMEIGDAVAAGIGVCVWCKANCAGVPEDALRAELARPCVDVHIRSEILQAEAVWLLREGRAAQAADVLTSAQKLGAPRMAPVLPWLATALRVQVEEASPYAPKRKKALVREAMATACRAERMARLYRNNLPHALREHALLAAALGRYRTAHRLFDESVLVASRQGMRAEVAQTKVSRGRVGLLAGWRGARDDLAEGERVLHALEDALARGAAPATEPATVSLAERFGQLLESGRRIASALTRDEVLAAVRDAADALLRGERSTLIEVRETASGQDLVLPRDVTPDRPSETLLRHALARGKPVAMLEGGGDVPSDSVILSGIRSAICAPIHERGKVTVLLYVTHRQVGRLFGETEERLAEFVATLAGAALENAAGFAERERLYREAKDAVRARDDFLSIAAHELRTPLTSIGLHIKSLARTARGLTRPVSQEVQSARLDAAEKALVGFEKLVGDLLDISRVNAQVALADEDVDLAEVARAVAARLEEDVEAARCSLDLTAPSPVVARWDRVRVEQIVLNLLSNAIKFGAGKPIEVEVAHEGLWARLSVRDHGIGIAPQDQARIFERFERAVSMQNYGGFGLGLWITRQNVEAMGGVIRVASSPAEGSTFTVELPMTGRASKDAAAPP
jgi:signal transduction histidine kinase/tetratricopeptide (TPR) repeat protein